MNAVRRGIALAACLLLAVASQAAETPPPRPAEWAQPVALEGVPNLHKITGTLYRGAQPTAEGFRNLQRLGVRTVVNLRSFHCDKDEISTTPLQLHSIPMKAWHPDLEEIVEFLQIVRKTGNAPVFVHCQQGADRTGTVCALYRVAVQGWTKEEALREMTGGGFGYHAVWVNLPPWIEKLDIEAIRKEAGMPRPAGPRRPGRGTD